MIDGQILQYFVLGIILGGLLVMLYYTRKTMRPEENLKTRIECLRSIAMEGKNDDSNTNNN